MSKKIIAILTIATILFVCVFAACERNEKEKLYADADEYEFVTDENGDRVLSEDGRFVVYATDEKGKYVTDESGEKVTSVKQFEPILDGDSFEDYGFKLTIPEGWKASEEKGNVFENKSLGLNCEIDVVEYFYDDYYDFSKNSKDVLSKEGIESTWEDDIDLGKDFKGTCRMVAELGDGIRVLYFFENSGNVYKILFSGGKDMSIVEETEKFCKSMTFKPFTYFDDITAVSKESTTLESTEAK